MRRWRGLVAVLILLALPAGAAAQEAPGTRVLVMPFAVEVEPGAQGGAAAALWLGEAASILLVERLAALGVGVLSRDQRVLAFERLRLPAAASLTRATTLRVGQLIGASEVIFGELQLGSTLRVRARTVHLGSGRELEAVVDEGPPGDIVASFDRVAAALALRTGRVRPPAETTLAPLPLEVFEDYVKGLVAPTLDAQQRFLESAVRVVPGDARIRMALWQVYSDLGMHERALASASTVSPQTPLAGPARFAVALSLIELGRLDGAFETLTALADAGPNGAVLNALGAVQLRRPEDAGGEPAAIYFRRAVEQEPENTDYLFNLGYALARTGTTDEALTWLREVVRLDAGSGDAHLVMSRLLSSTGRAPEAARERELAALLGTSTPVISGDLPGAVPAGLERLPTTPDVTPAARLSVVIANPSQRDQAAAAAFHRVRGKEFITAQRDREAIDELRRAVYLAPYDAESHLLLGQAYHRVGQVDQAIDELKVSVWCAETAAARIALARALLDAGERDAAIQELDRAAVLAPNSAEVEALRQRAGP